ncbi:MAG TPA: PTS sugar transporter subunit IIA [bacterium]|jgi:PTS system nitrogen regulatory IIA component|nr:PTS sugar transporter subunit IIA [bacterium]HNT66748.1 PTS sugar transporter subunit IIA [bacterium]HOX87643.1 PTS sugar transporter subunit IIA [bacterium]HPG44967.1 PTS sugar transporter subunit IIA [bacterium]HPM99621.1 PTS sugar transporter subunit IIA [bacterium]
MRKSELASHFNPALFIPELKATDKEAVLKELLDLFVKEKHIRNSAIVLEMLHQREKLGSTGIGKGVAIPHGRTVAASDVLIAFGKSTAGVPFDAMDGKPVHLFFMVIAPPNDEGNVYLQILGSLMPILSDAENLQRMKAVREYNEFIEVIRGE